MVTLLHVVDLGEELSLRNGSAVLSVAASLTSAANSRGATAFIGGSADRLADRENCVGILSASAQSNALQRFWDAASRATLGTRRIEPERVGRTETEPDVVFLHNRPWDAPAFRRAFPNSQIVLYLHNRTMRWALPRAKRRALSKFDAVITVSDYIRGDLISRSRLRDASAVTAILNAPPGRHFDNGLEPASDILYVGRLNRSKGVHLLLKALSEVQAARPLTVRIVGGKNFLPSQAVSRYERRIRLHAEKIAHKIEFVGPVPPQQIQEEMARARLLVVPSIWNDPCPLTVFEGMESPAGVVAADVGGIPEQGAAGGIAMFPRKDHRQLAQILSTLLASPSQLTELANEGQAAAGTRTWRIVELEIDDALTPRR